MILPRSSGVLLHPTSLPGRFGSGDFGPGARHFIDWLATAGQRVWQVLPLTPPAAGDSPYMARSALAGNPLLISPEVMCDHGFLRDADLEESPAHSHDGETQVEFATVSARRMHWLEIAADNFFQGRTRAASTIDLRAPFDDWCAENNWWADDYALFMALGQAHGFQCWTDWPAELRSREQSALDRARRTYESTIRFWLFVQWQFDVQWQSVREYARARGIRIVGDMPIYCALDSADVWQQPSLFELDDSFLPSAVAGVPPDYFSETGQLWGNPLYDWAAHASQNYQWWCHRMGRALSHADVVRIDHFRAFAAYWSVPADQKTAIGGQWRDGPGIELFLRMQRVLGELPLIAEDLGTITPDVIELRDQIGLPGMCVLQFAFGDGPDNRYLPHNYSRNCIVYTGTHDNDTTEGWFASADPGVRHNLNQYLNLHGQPVSWSVMQLASASIAQVCVFPMQDVLALGSDARMNTPGIGAGQWAWRLSWAQVDSTLAVRLRSMTVAHGRAE